MLFSASLLYLRLVETELRKTPVAILIGGNLAKADDPIPSRLLPSTTTVLVGPGRLDSVKEKSPVWAAPITLQNVSHTDVMTTKSPKTGSRRLALKKCG